MGILVHFLAHDADLQQQLRDQPSLLPKAIDEILRVHGPLVANRRITTRPVQVGGFKIGAGESISLNWISANRDGEIFEEPETVRLDRDPAQNLLYGAGIHVCPGAPLASLEMRVAMEELLGRTTHIEPSPGKPSTKAMYPASGFANLPLRIRGPLVRHALNLRAGFAASLRFRGGCRLWRTFDRCQEGSADPRELYSRAIDVGLGQKGSDRRVRRLPQQVCDGPVSRISTKLTRCYAGTPGGSM
jgi:hypothetical protein